MIGSRGLSRFKRTFQGSVSDYVLHRASCPVCICRNTGASESRKGSLAFGCDSRKNSLSSLASYTSGASASYYRDPSASTSQEGEEREEKIYTPEETTE